MDSQPDVIASALQGLASDLERVDLGLIAQPLREARALNGHHKTLTNSARFVLVLAASSLAYRSHDWALLAGRLALAGIAETAPKRFSLSVERLAPILDGQFLAFCRDNREALDAMVRPERDLAKDIFAISTLAETYLFRDAANQPAETPQYMYLRVAVWHWFSDPLQALEGRLGAVGQMYDDLSLGRLSPASPQMFNAGTKKAVGSSCFMLQIDDDTADIARSWRTTAFISKAGGGMGLDYSRLRSSKLSKGGAAAGVMRFLKIQGAILQAFDQCFLPLTRVLTPRGPRPIWKLAAGDRVLDGGGQWGRVHCVKVHHPSGLKEGAGLVGLATALSEAPVFVTSGHPVSAVGPVPQAISLAAVREQLCAGRLGERFVPAGSLGTDYLVSFPVPPPGPSGALEAEAEAEAVLAGLFFVEGAEFADHVQLRAPNARTTEFLDEFFGERGLPFSRARAEGSSETTYSCMRRFFPLPPFASVRLPKSLAEAPVEAVRAFVRGLLLPYEARGSVELAAEKKRDAWLLVSVFLRLGVIPEVRGRTVSFRTDGEELVPAVSFSYAGRVYTRLTSVSRLDRSLLAETDLLYDLEIEEGLRDESRASFATVAGVAQNGGKRKGMATAWLPMWHSAADAFVEMRRDDGLPALRNKDLFNGVAIPDLFMRRVKERGDWTLMCPHEARAGSRSLVDLWGTEFELLYEELERQGVGRRVPAMDLWKTTLLAMIESGGPFTMFTDAANRKSNYKHLGKVQISNLCTEILEMTTKDELPSCNLTSVGLPSIVVTRDGKATVDLGLLADLARRAVRNLNRVIDVSYYDPTIPELEASNKRHRPIGIGVQGLADVFAMLGLPYASPEARRLNREIFETLYFSAVDESAELARELGPHPSFEGSPASQGLLQPHLWQREEGLKRYEATHSLDGAGLSGEALDTVCYTDKEWKALVAKVQRHGMRNIAVVALMPTASSAQLLGNSESYECFSSMLYTRTVLAGTFVVGNRHLENDMRSLGLWDQTVAELLKTGSVQGLALPEGDQRRPELERLKRIYLGVYEMKQKPLVDMAVERGRFVDHSQSFNIHLDGKNAQVLSDMLTYCWKRGFKTTYYVRTQPAALPTNFFKELAEKAAGPADEATNGLGPGASQARDNGIPPKRLAVAREECINGSCCET